MKHHINRKFKGGFEPVNEIINVNFTSISTIMTDELIPEDKPSIKCAPHLKFQSGSCIDLPVLVEMAVAYNKEGKDTIKLHPRLETLNPPKYKKFLLREIKTRFKNKCNTDQICWTQQDFINRMNDKMQEELTKYTFRPEGPKARFEWLNTTQLNEVMEQYEKKYPDFKFLGAVPNDFDDLEMLGIRDLDYDELYNKGIRKLGIIFNLDNHDQGGSHWVAAYTDFNSGKTYFSDSYGNVPDARIRKLLRRFSSFCEKKTGKHAEAEHNKLRHQYGNSECGMYSMNFILELLEGTDFNELANKQIPDDRVNNLRPIFFRDVEFN